MLRIFMTVWTELKVDADATADAPEKASAKAPELVSKAANETPDIVKKRLNILL